MHYSKEEKAKYLEEWKQSGKSAWAYAREKGINLQTFLKWKKAETEVKNSFVEIPAQITKSTPLMTEILIEKGDIRIHVPLVLSDMVLEKIGIGHDS